MNARIAVACLILAAIYSAPSGAGGCAPRRRDPEARGRLDPRYGGRYALYGGLPVGP